MSELVIEVKKREQLGSNASRRLRRDDLIPAVVYGGKRESVSIVVPRRTVLELLHSSGGENAVFELTLGDQRRHAMVRELQVDPVTGQIEHIDFQRINMSEKVHVAVPLELEGTAQGVKNEGGILDFISRELNVECLPGDIPPHLTVDVSALHLGQHLEAKDVALPEGVVLLDDPERVILTISAPRVAAAESEEDEGLLEAAKEEPKVIGRKDEDED
ncbi:MAG: 50S ribosomal protein L25 [Acidobacteria bacterium]|nr:50S ribosomal protein L25 [Acidobacteriota bacterium]